MMDKDVPGFVRYTSWRRTLPSGKTEYKSVTISPNATAREFSDLYLDDDFRCVVGLSSSCFALHACCMHVFRIGLCALVAVPGMTANIAEGKA
jgi:hypothetical protein